MVRSIHFDALAIGGPPRVVGTISDPSALGPGRWPNSSAYDVAELRFDLLGWDHPHAFATVAALRRLGVPVLGTVRSAREGGGWTRSEAERRRAYGELLPRVSAIDVELRSELSTELVAQAHAEGRPVVGSFHDFAGTPTADELRALVAQGAALGVDIVKLAVRTETSEALERLRALLDLPGRPLLSLLGMGALGPASRVSLARAGSCLTYGYADVCNAPGQVASAELVAALRGGSSPAR